MIHYGEVTEAADRWGCHRQKSTESKGRDTFTKWPRRTNMAPIFGRKCFATDKWKDIYNQALGM